MVLQNARIGLRSLFTNPLRTILTLSGVIIGIASIVAVVSIGEGHRRTIFEKIQSMGGEIFWVTESRRGFREDGISLRREQLSPRDAESIQSRCTSVSAVAPVNVSMISATTRGEEVKVNLVETAPDFMKVKLFRILAGRYLNDWDMISSRDVCVIEENSSVKMLIRPGQFITTGNTRRTVVGIVSRSQNLMGSQTAMTLHVPLRIPSGSGQSRASIETIYCRAKEGEIENAQRQVREVLESPFRRGLAIDIRGPRDLVSAAEDLTKTATMVTGGIGMIALFVGGIGLMNILLASVAERVNELGLRRAVGAKRRDVLFQLMFESIALSVLGGVIGSLLGILTSGIISEIANVPVTVSLVAVGLGLTSSFILGLVFGIFPAWKAGSLNPVEALRYE